MWERFLTWRRRRQKEAAIAKMYAAFFPDAKEYRWYELYGEKKVIVITEMDFEEYKKWRNETCIQSTTQN